MSAHTEHNIVGILLAAGRGKRFDPSGEQNKLLQSIESGDKVVVASAKNLLAVLPKVIAVVRDLNDPAATELIQIGCDVVACAQADQGMASSLVHALQHATDATGWIIALGDMPYVQSFTISSLITALHEGANIAVPSHDGQRGNPVGFDRLHLDELLQLSGDRGARALLQQHPVTEVEVDDAGIHTDIDTPSDLPGLLH